MQAYVSMAGLALTALLSSGQTVDPGPVPAGIAEGAITPELVAEGDELFNSGPCVKCHLQAGRGGPRAPALDDDEWLHGDGSFRAIRETIWKGVPKERLADPDRPFAMNPGGGLSDPDAHTLDALAAYIRSLSR